MKTLLFSLTLVLSINSFAQKKTKTPFLRVFNLEGKKIAKGKLLRITDSTLHLKAKYKNEDIYFSDIGIIKTKRSVGNNIITGASIGGGTLFIIGAAAKTRSNSNSLTLSRGEGSIAGPIIGIPAGSLLGGVTSLFKKSKTFEINGNQEQWISFKTLFSD